MLKWAKDLFPICRSITGRGTRRTLNYFKRINPEFKTINNASQLCALENIMTRLFFKYSILESRIALAPVSGIGKGNPRYLQIQFRFYLSCTIINKMCVFFCRSLIFHFFHLLVKKFFESQNWSWKISRYARNSSRRDIFKSARIYLGKSNFKNVFRDQSPRISEFSVLALHLFLDFHRQN